MPNLCIYERNGNFFKKSIDKDNQNCYNLLSRLTATIQMVCGCSSMARISAFQADCVGSIPITRFFLFAPVAQLDRATAF